MRKTKARLKTDAAEFEQRTIQPITTCPESILEAIEVISESAYGTGMTDAFLKAVELPANYISQRLQITPMQAVLFALIVDQSDDSYLRLRDLAELTRCSTPRMLRFSNHLEGLEKRRFICISRSRSYDTYRIPREVMKSLREDTPYKYKPAEILDVKDFFEQYGKLLDDRHSNEIDYDGLMEACLYNLGQIRKSHFANALESDLPTENLRILFIHMAFLYYMHRDDCIGFSDIDYIYDWGEMPIEIKGALRGHIADCLSKLIENVCDEGLTVPDKFKLTNYAKDDLLAELDLNMSRHNTKLTRHDSLPEKRLIYNAREKEQIEILADLLKPDRFKNVQSSLEEAGMRQGFCCLFYGAPGTGKTETVYQLARMTGRDIMQVNVDQIKSCWVGESEKNIKMEFDTYRRICREREVAPILLFNEADAVLGLRMEGATRGVEKMENSIQNIILQEMESLPGIMIATTNLTANLDQAFERRFLYKIEYSKPTVEARAKIWQGMMKGLGNEDARTLARRFDLSGGEIENIVRKHSVNAILSGKNVVDIDALIKMCEQERINSGNRRRVGF